MPGRSSGMQLWLRVEVAPFIVVGFTRSLCRSLWRFPHFLHNVTQSLSPFSQRLMSLMCPPAVLSPRQSLGTGCLM